MNERKKFISVCQQSRRRAAKMHALGALRSHTLFVRIQKLKCGVERDDSRDDVGD